MLKAENNCFAGRPPNKPSCSLDPSGRMQIRRFYKYPCVVVLGLTVLDCIPVKGDGWRERSSMMAIGVHER